jgi:leucyl-tRNA---protein transferase
VILPPPPELPTLGAIYVSGDSCSYFRDGRPSRTAYSQPSRLLSATQYDVALGLGMRRSGTILYRPICPGCRKCQPFRIDVARFEASKSQRRVIRKCEHLFHIHAHEPRLDNEHLDLFTRYQAFQHGEHGIEADAESYHRFLGESVVETLELSWRDASSNKLVAVGILDVVPSGLSTVYFYWDPELRDYSLGTYSALMEITLCKRWNKPYYYLGYLVPGAPTMNYKAAFGAAEVWNGTCWIPVPGRGLEEPAVLAVLAEAESQAIVADGRRFAVDEET